MQVTAVPGREQVNLQGTQTVMALLAGSCSPTASWNLSFPASKETILHLSRIFANKSIELFCPQRFYRKCFVMWNITGLGSSWRVEVGHNHCKEASGVWGVSPANPREGKVWGKPQNPAAVGSCPRYRIRTIKPLWSFYLCALMSQTGCSAFLRQFWQRLDAASPAPGHSLAQLQQELSKEVTQILLPQNKILSLK